MGEETKNAKHVAVPVAVWSAVIELLTAELPMKKVEGLVTALRQSQPITLAQTKGGEDAPD